MTLNTQKLKVFLLKNVTESSSIFNMFIQKTGQPRPVMTYFKPNPEVLISIEDFSHNLDILLKACPNKYRPIYIHHHRCHSCSLVNTCENQLLCLLDMFVRCHAYIQYRGNNEFQIYPIIIPQQ